METKKCPYCRKTILASSKVCKHCGKSFDLFQLTNNESFISRKKANNILKKRHKGFIGSVILGIVILLISFFSLNQKKNSVSSSKLKNLQTELIQQQNHEDPNHELLMRKENNNVTHNYSDFPNEKKLKSVVENYYKCSKDKNFDGLSEIFVYTIERFFSQKHINRESALVSYIEYNKNFYNQHFNINWDSFKISEKSDNTVSISYNLKYDFQWYKPYYKNGYARPNYFEEKIFVKINMDYQIISIYEEILYRSVI